ncbi:MAG TPA: HAMP domain-containing sensor histidine kinase [Anaerolineales bacterium]|nr:HAMP domain-containing sensor histidine kinase [Anaerolineales bacterium]
MTTEQTPKDGTAMFPPHRPQGRPPWWPENELWPPRGPFPHYRWPHTRRRFFWRFGGFLAFTFLLLTGGCTLISLLAVAALRWLDLPEGALPILLTGVLVVGAAGLTLLGRALRGVAAPFGDLIEAAGRVEAGDYGARVPERGPREVRALARAFNAMSTRLQQIDRQRRDLLADVTHELRTPLTVIQGNLEGVLDAVYPADDGHIRPILEEARLLSRLLDDLQSLALVEAGALQLHREPTDLAVLADDALAPLRAPAEFTGVALRIDFARDLPLADVDAVRIREVFTNLLTNALRHSPRGGVIEVSAALEADGQWIAVSVSDVGDGIPAESLPHIFDRFQKSDRARGSGLGLAIAKKLVMAHGGEIVARSEGMPRQGTTITFTLPVATP